MAKRNLNMNMEEDLIVKVDNYAKLQHVNRTAAFHFIISQYFLGLDLTRAIIETNERQSLKK